MRFGKNSPQIEKREKFCRETESIDLWVRVLQRRKNGRSGAEESRPNMPISYLYIPPKKKKEQLGTYQIIFYISPFITYQINFWNQPNYSNQNSNYN